MHTVKGSSKSDCLVKNDKFQGAILTGIIGTMNWALVCSSPKCQHVKMWACKNVNMGKVQDWNKETLDTWSWKWKKKINKCPWIVPIQMHMSSKIWMFT